VAVIRDPDLPVGSGQYGAMQSVAPSIGVELKPVNMRDPTEIERGIATIARSPNGGIVVSGSPFASKYRELIMTCRAGTARRHTRGQRRAAKWLLIQLLF
jgi:putative ABC transport system substrate-binding protein